MINPFESALRQLHAAAKSGDISAELIERLCRPEREITVSIPVGMDNGDIRFFEGFRVQHSSLRGPYKGGVRFHPNVDLDEVRALALWMTIKTAVAGVAMGGGKGGVVVDPSMLSALETERLARGFVKCLYRNLGPEVDIPAPDVNTNAEIMSFMAEEYATITNDKSNAAFTGKLIAKGGSEGREAATALGGYYVFEVLRQKVELPKQVTVAVQGMGNVGGNAARIFAEHGHKVVAMSDSKGAIYKEDGLNPETVERYKKEHHTLSDYPGIKPISNEELLELPVDVLVPAALENQITKENAYKMKTKMILELANGPTTPDADEILHEREIKVVPDVLANAGGVVVSTFEWEQNRQGEKWSESEVFEKLEKTLVPQAEKVWSKSQENSTNLRVAAYILALERLAAVYLKD